MYLFHILPKKNTRRLVPFELKDMASTETLQYPIQTIYTSTQSETVCFSCEVPHGLLLFQEIKICHRHSNMCSVVCDLTFHLVHTKLLGRSENSVKDAAKRKSRRRRIIYRKKTDLLNLRALLLEG